MLPGHSPFTFRFAPRVEYLNWRYNLSLSFVRYRLFRILAGARSIGYIILASGTSNWLINYDWSDNGFQAPFLDQPDER